MKFFFPNTQISQLCRQAPSLPKGHLLCDLPASKGKERQVALPWASKAPSTCLVPMVEPVVLVEIWALAKAFPTLAALVWFLPSVDSLVQFQSWLPPKAVSAFPTDVGSLSCVYSLMSLQLWVPREALPTVIAFVRFLCCVGCLVAKTLQKAAQASSASFAFL